MKRMKKYRLQRTKGRKKHKNLDFWLEVENILALPKSKIKTLGRDMGLLDVPLRRCDRCGDVTKWISREVKKMKSRTWHFLIGQNAVRQRRGFLGEIESFSSLVPKSKKCSRSISDDWSFQKFRLGYP